MRPLVQCSEGSQVTAKLVHIQGCSCVETEHFTGLMNLPSGLLWWKDCWGRHSQCSLDSRPAPGHAMGSPFPDRKEGGKIKRLQDCWMGTSHINLRLVISSHEQAFGFIWSTWVFLSSYWLLSGTTAWTGWAQRGVSPILYGNPSVPKTLFIVLWNTMDIARTNLQHIFKANLSHDFIMVNSPSSGTACLPCALIARTCSLQLRPWEIQD